MGLPVYANSAETGAPQLTNATGSMEALLNALLVTGFRVQTPTSITVSSGVATVTLAGHGYSDMRVVNVGGATPAGLNGDKFIRVTGSGTFTYPAPGVADGTATGTISVKRASCGWTRPHNSGGVSIFDRSDLTATDMALRIDDSGSGVASATHARVREVWDYTDINTWANQAPLDAQVSGGLYWVRGPNTSAPKHWVFIGDGRTFYLFVEGSTYTPMSSYGGVPAGPMVFGDLQPFRSGDAHHAILSGDQGANDGAGESLGRFRTLGSSGSNGAWLARPAWQVGQPVRAGLLGPGNSATVGGGGPLYPSPVDNGLVIAAPALVYEESGPFSHPIRGVLRGVGLPMATVNSGQLHLQILENLAGSTARWLMVGFQNFGSPGCLAFKLDEAWD